MNEDPTIQRLDADPAAETTPETTPETVPATPEPAETPAETAPAETAPEIPEAPAADPTPPAERNEPHGADTPAEQMLDNAELFAEDRGRAATAGQAVASAEALRQRDEEQGITPHNVWDDRPAIGDPTAYARDGYVEPEPAEEVDA